MESLRTIASRINEVLKANVFSDKRFTDSDYNAIAYPVVSDNREPVVIMPCVPIETLGEYKPMFFNDTRPFTLYHKVLNSSYQKDAQYGRAGGRAMKLIATMQMIVLANRSLTGLLPDEFEMILASNFPEGNEANFSNITGMSVVSINPLSSNMNFEQLHNAEFKGIEYKVNPDRMILAVNYTIESAFNKRCFKVCDCQANAGSN